MSIVHVPNYELRKKKKTPTKILPTSTTADHHNHQNTLQIPQQSGSEPSKRYSFYHRVLNKLTPNKDPIDEEEAAATTSKKVKKKSFYDDDIINLTSKEL